MAQKNEHLLYFSSENKMSFTPDEIVKVSIDNQLKRCHPYDIAPLNCFSTSIIVLEVQIIETDQTLIANDYQLFSITNCELTPLDEKTLLEKIPHPIFSLGKKSRPIFFLGKIKGTSDQFKTNATSFCKQIKALYDKHNQTQTQTQSTSTAIFEKWIDGKIPL